MDTKNNKRLEVYTAACNYVAAGLEVIYDHPEKKNPQITNWQTREFTLDELEEKILGQGWYVGIRNIEGLDFDNNGNPDADEMLRDWKEMVHKECPGIINRLLIEKTRSGGFHVVWKCEVIEGSQKLAERPSTEEEKARKPNQTYVLIETRGKGGQFVVSPSPGYVLMQGDWLNLPVITSDERLVLLRCARAFDRVPKVQEIPKELYAGEKRPGDKYNESEEGKTEAFQLLIESGWSVAYERENSVYLSRPGKSKNEGISASFGYVAPGIFYNFSTNGTPFESGRAYSPFAIFTLLKFNGDFSRAAKELVKLSDVGGDPHSFNYRLTDLGNAEKIAEYFGDQVRYDHKQKRWLVWREPHWRPDVDGEIYRLAIESAKNRYKEACCIEDLALRAKVSKWAISSENRTRLEAACAVAKNIPPIFDSGDNWDQKIWLISCENGIVDLKTGLLREGRREDLITMSTGTNYNPDAKCPLWKQFLNEIFEGNTELIHFVHKALGYSLTGDMSEQALFFCFGAGANGKSVLISVLQKVLGDYSHNVPFSTFQKQGARSNTNDLAALELRRFVVSSEALGGNRLDETVLKNISGGDPVSARYLFKEFRTFIPHCKIWFFVNHKPLVKDDSYGFWRRVRLIPFTRTFEKDKQDKQLASKLQIETEGVLAWLVEGALLWQKEGLIPVPKAVEEATAQYQRESDILSDYIYERCVVRDDVQVKAIDLWKSYTAWEDDQGISDKEKLGSKSFYVKIAEKFTKIRTKEGKIYKGISLETSYGDGSHQKGEAGDGLDSENTETSSFSPPEDMDLYKGAEESPVTGNDDESPDLIENHEALEVKEK